MFAGSQTAFAETVLSAAVGIEAVISASLSLDMTVKEETSAAPLTFGAAVASMPHGTLVRPVNPDGTPGALRGKTYHVWFAD